MRTTRKLGLAMVVVALIIGSATPAGAANKPVQVVSGTITMALGNFDLTPGSQGPDPCNPKPSTLRFTTAENNPPTFPPTGTWTLTGGFSGQFQFPPASGTWFQIDFTFLAGNGNWNGVASTQAMAGFVVLQMRITFIGSAVTPNCSKNITVCTMTGVFTVTVPSTYKAGAGNPGLPSTRSGDRVTVTATTSTPITISTCVPPFNSVGGTMATITDLQAVVL